MKLEYYSRMRPISYVGTRIHLPHLKNMCYFHIVLGKTPSQENSVTKPHECERQGKLIWNYFLWKNEFLDLSKKEMRMQ